MISKVIGWIIVITISLAVIAVYVWAVFTTGVYVLVSLGAAFLFCALLYFGYWLITKDEK